MNFQSNEQSTVTNNDTSIYLNDNQPNNSLPSNIESRFSPTTNYALDFHSINELVDLHKKLLRKRKMYCYYIFGISSLIGLILLIVGFVHPTCSIIGYNCPTAYTVCLALGGSLIFFGIVIVLTLLCDDLCREQQYEDVNFSVNGQQPVVWRLDGEPWVRYLKYIHGPNRMWTQMNPWSSFCCRLSTYERLMNRQYGHIILHEKGLIIDELYFVSFRAYTLEGVEILCIDQHPQIIGLRIHTYFQAGKNSRSCYYDLFAPSSVSFEQIQALARAYIIKIYGVSALRSPLTVIRLPRSILSALN
ncbi:unnamed protein product [Adineta steineri]|uniref:Transmembrane protein n=1 Tax=Adineta steineri TaxID=433720 RepID=A0A814PGU9_9BILA|nr:unnamed protein product [Adineta steineri]CAF1036822.1 unnamed protein product [Adineta steineri]CAF1104877.1 unnamed protein product [Adineta steineri]